MEIDKIYTGSTEDEIWQQLAPDINYDILEYHALLEQGTQKIYLDIDIDLGGGFEGGYATTSYSAPVQGNGFRFGIHEEHFTDEVGRFFGMQDVKTGYDELDHHLVIKTNDEAKVKTLFTNGQVRSVFTQLTDFDFGIHLHDVEGSDEQQAFLELNIEDGITNAADLKELYSAFYDVLIRI